MTMNLGSRHGKCPEFDAKIGNMRSVFKAGHPKKRYFMISTEGVKTHYLNLIEARWDVKSNPDSYREVTDADLQDELSTRGTRFKSGKTYAEVIENTDDTLKVVLKDGTQYTLLKVAA